LSACSNENSFPSSGFSSSDIFFRDFDANLKKTNTRKKNAKNVDDDFSKCVSAISCLFYSIFSCFFFSFFALQSFSCLFIEMENNDIAPNQ